jgi:hypothetical protein
MSIISFTCKTLGGALNPVNGPVEKIRVSRDEEAEVILSGFIGAGRIKKGDDYVPEAFGRLTCKAALVGTGAKQRYYLDIAGGLRGVLFKNNEKGDNAKAPDYVGNVEVGDMVYPLYGRKIQGENGHFIGLSSGEIEPKRERNSGGGGTNGTNGTNDAPPPAGDDIPW